MVHLEQPELVGGSRRRGEQQALGGPGPSPDPPPQLVQLRQAVALGVLHQHHRRLWDVDAHLDDRGAHQDLTRGGSEGGGGEGDGERVRGRGGGERPC